MGLRPWRSQVPKARLNHRHVQPSLRDLYNRPFQPNSELLGYYRFSLREIYPAVFLGKAEFAKMPKLQRPAIDRGLQNENRGAQQFCP